MSGSGNTVPDRMVAVMIREPGGLPVAGEMPVRRPGRGEVLVRVAAAPINPSDLGFLLGSYGLPAAFPVVPGFEGSGTVVAAGAGVMGRLLAGRRVACATNAASGGTWAEYVVIPAASCIPLPRRVSLEQGATAIVNPMTALAFFEMARREKHSAIVNTAAAGALGQMILRLGLRERIPVLHIVRRKEQADRLASLGARHVLQSTDPGFLDRFRLLSGQLNATLILDAVGGEFSRQMMEASPFGSTLVAYGFLSGEQTRIDTRPLAKEDKRVIGFFLPNWMKKKHPLGALMAFVRMRRLLASDLATNIQKRFAFTAVGEALNAVRESTTGGKFLLVPDRDAAHT